MPTLKSAIVSQFYPYDIIGTVYTAPSWLELGPNLHSITPTSSAQCVWIPSHVEVLDNMYSFSDYTKVAKFLNGNRHIADLLIELYAHISRSFGLDVVATIEVNDDDDVQQAYLLIHTKCDPETALARLDYLFQTWWFQQSKRAQLKLIIDVEYI